MDGAAGVNRICVTVIGGGAVGGYGGPRLDNSAVAPGSNGTRAANTRTPGSIVIHY